jgi:hypothetical protein
MENHLHRVLGIYASRADAEPVFERLVERGIPRAGIQIVSPGQGGIGAEAHADSDDVLKDVLRDGAIGTAVGAMAGVAGTVALAAANFTLFVASPLLGALYLLGWGASVGGTVGAVVGSGRRKGDVSELMEDALAHGHTVLVAHVDSELQTTWARQIIGESMQHGEREARVDA